MSSRSRTKKKPQTRARRSAPRRQPPSLPKKLPSFKLEQHQLDLIGLGLVALAAFLAFVFYLGWDGGKVGEGLANAFIFLFGGVGYLIPVALFGTGAVLVLRELLPSVRPFRSGAICLLLALMLGLAAGSLGLGPDHPVREGFFHPDFFREHGGAVGELLFFVSKTLFSTFGAHIIFVFLMLAGILLLTGGSVAGVVSATRTGVVNTTRRIRPPTGEFDPVRGGPAPRRWDEPLDDDELPPIPADVEPVVRATHVEAPARDTGEEDAYEPEPEPAEAAESELSEEVFEPPPPPEGAEESDDAEQPEPDLTPMGNYRSDVLEADDNVYSLPRPGVLKRSGAAARPDMREQERTAGLLVEALGHFGVEASVVGTVAGPHVTRYELRLAPGIKMSKVSQLKDDIAYALAATDVRILAPIPGKTAVGVEVPNANRRIVHLGDVYQQAPEGWSPLTVWLGKDIAGKAIGTDLAKQPHVLVAGTTGSGKSGCVNAMLSSILLRATPNEVKLVLVDPKQVELNHYESIPHLLTPVVTSPRLAANVLANLIKEMEERYAVMSAAKTRSLPELNRVRVREGERP